MNTDLAADLPVSEPPINPTGISAFTSLAMTMATICIVAGGLTSFHVGLCGVGGAAVGIGWPVGCLFALIVALTMGQLASAFPRSGGPYLWAAILGGRGWGWATACFGLVGLITVLAAVNIGTCSFAVQAVMRQFGVDQLDPVWIKVAGVLITFSQALINHLSLRLTTRLVDMSGYLILAVAVLLTGCMVWFGLILAPNGVDFSRLVTFENFSDVPGSYYQKAQATSDSVVWLFLLGLLLPAYTVTGFDGPAQVAEETADPTRSVPRGIVRGVVISGIAGWIMLCAVMLAIPNLRDAAEQNDEVILYVIRLLVPQPLRTMLYVGILAAMYLCGLATLMSVSRLAASFARDRGLPFSSVLQHFGPFETPGAATWTVATVVAVAVVAVEYETIAAICAAFLYLSYVIPTLFGLLTHGRSWTRKGPWHLGPWYRPLAAACVVGCAGLIFIGLHPPTQIAAPIVGATVVGMVVLWFAYIQFRFPGPPPEVIKLRSHFDE